MSSLKPIAKGDMQMLKKLFLVCVVGMALIFFIQIFNSYNYKNAGDHTEDAISIRFIVVLATRWAFHQQQVAIKKQRFTWVPMTPHHYRLSQFEL
ncbi:hypothetical protein DRW07_01960 [Alteromonas sediminis]|uniref:Uncharacterized protein n=1 Tax=Alteromonas sediminis TaxID=2259342 RepID=A0A3N5Y2P3_9ALTE|nr:hypothetical protein [Alteromonas sediminis]RPJ68197.1 hypothetical protein DRW07_01960 [Alteromonas sediminis]